jgi:hypothetical protein
LGFSLLVSTAVPVWALVEPCSSDSDDFAPQMKAFAAILCRLTSTNGTCFSGITILLFVHTIIAALSGQLLRSNPTLAVAYTMNGGANVSPFLRSSASPKRINLGVRGSAPLFYAIFELLKRSS